MHYGDRRVAERLRQANTCTNSYAYADPHSCADRHSGAYVHPCA